MSSEQVWSVSQRPNQPIAPCQHLTTTNVIRIINSENCQEIFCTKVKISYIYYNNKTASRASTAYCVART